MSAAPQKPKYKVFDEDAPDIFTAAAAPEKKLSFLDTVAAQAPTVPTISASAPAAPAPAAPPTPSNILDQMCEVVRTFAAQNSVKLYILTPCYAALCHVDYMTCLIQTLDFLRKCNIEVQVEFCKNDSLVPRARNNLIARAMNDPRMTHVLFIDSDIVWTPDSVVKLLLSEKDIVGGIYPLKHYYWNKLTVGGGAAALIEKKNASQLRAYISDEQMIEYNMVRYNVNYMDNVLNIENNITEVRHLATGFMCIRRKVIENLMKAYPSTKYIDDVSFLKGSENDWAFAIFDTAVEVINGTRHYLSEDWLWCERARAIGYKTFCDVSINLGHNGNCTFAGSFVSSLI
jgi:hypothetical protein